MCAYEGYDRRNTLLVQGKIDAMRVVRYPAPAFHLRASSSLIFWMAQGSFHLEARHDA